MPKTPLNRARMTPEPLDVMIGYSGGAAVPAFVTPLGNDRYRIEGDTLCSFVTEDPRRLRRVPRCGDVIEARAINDHTLEFVKVVTRARLKRFQFLISPAIAESPRLERILARVVLRRREIERGLVQLTTGWLP